MATVTLKSQGDVSTGRHLAVLAYAMQPIVSIRTGEVFGYEALLRGFEKLGFEDPQAVIDDAETAGLLAALDLGLRAKALDAFLEVPHSGAVRLFYNLDLRVLRPGADDPALTRALLEARDLSPNHLCFELSERQDDAAGTLAAAAISRYHAERYRLALDDFGTGYSGLKLLYAHQPDFIKIDRFFISGIDADQKKKLFVSTVVDLAHVMGIQVVAEGVESERELATCRDIGCDLAQGFLIARPSLDYATLPDRVTGLLTAFRERRRRRDDSHILREQMERVPTLRLDQPMTEVFEAFRRDTRRTFFPVLDDRGGVVGLVREVDLKEYTYSKYGRDLINNRRYGRKLADFISRCPIADIGEEAERILHTWSLSRDTEGVAITDGGAYAGFLSAASLLRVINEKNLATARDQNPLTRLPGNISVAALLDEAVADGAARWILVYLDFDRFKPFNDQYGFRQGDRAIQLFAELLRKHVDDSAHFLGHVGGDDFVVAFRDTGVDEARAIIADIIERFARDVESFYDPVSRQRGHILAEDRDGRRTRFPLMTCSAAMILLPAAARRPGAESLSRLIARAKSEAKSDPTGLTLTVVEGDEGRSPVAE